MPLVLLGVEGGLTAGGGWVGCKAWDRRGGFFFFLLGVGASYVRKDSKDMVGVSKVSTSSSSPPRAASGDFLRSRDLPGEHTGRDIHGNTPHILSTHFILD